MANKVTGDRHVLRESSHTTKGNTHIYINNTQPEYDEYYLEEHRTGEGPDTYFSVKSNFKKHLSLWKICSKSKRSGV